MLTPEEERKRAIAISKLYNRKNRPVTIEKPLKSTPFPFYSVWKLSFVLLVPVAVVYTLINLFLGLDYSSAADIQGAGIAFVGMLIIVGLVSFRTLSNYRNNMKSLISNETFLFWLILLFLVPLVFLARVLFGLDSTNGVSFLALKLGLSSLLILVFSSSYILLLARTLEIGNSNKRYLVAFLLAIVPGLVYSYVS